MLMIRYKHDALEGEERDADRQHDSLKCKIYPCQRRDVLQYKNTVFEER